jgi:hypothetical protein
MVTKFLRPTRAVPLPAVRSCWPLIFAVCAAGAAGAEGQEPEPSRRLPPPDGQAIAAAKQLVLEAYEADFAEARRDPSKLSNLLDKLLEAAERTEQPDRAYALFIQVEKTALEAGGLDDLLRAVEGRAERFAVAADEERVSAFRSFLKRHSSDHLKLEGAATQVLEDSAARLARDELETAIALLEVAAEANSAAATAARRARDKSTDFKAQAKEIASLQGRIDQRRVLKAAAEQAGTLLATNPDDQRANATLGSYECLVAGRWFSGLPTLAKGDIDDLAAAARLELALLADDDPASADILATANAWWASAQEKDRSPDEAAAIKQHAAGLYRRLDGKLLDPTDLILAQKRAEEGAAGAVEPEAGGGPFSGRRRAAKLAAAGGGGADTEEALDRALVWLAAHQLPDGGWSFDLSKVPACRGQCRHSGRNSCRTGATSLALLPFLGRGNTLREGPYKRQVEAGIGFLVKAATQGNGKAYGTAGNLYSQGVATIAMAECYGMTKDKRLQAPTQAMLNFIMQAQDPNGGGWRYSPGQAGDTSAVGWQLTALKTGNLAGLQVNPLTVKKAVSFLDSVQSDGGAVYGYTDARKGSLALSAVGLHCRMQLGWNADHPAVRKGVERFSLEGPNRDLYYCYYATQVMHRAGGDAWKAWNDSLKPILLMCQAKAGHEAGSWHDGVDGGHGPSVAGRLFCTSLAALILEQYYR